MKKGFPPKLKPLIKGYEIEILGEPTGIIYKTFKFKIQKSSKTKKPPFKGGFGYISNYLGIVTTENGVT